MTCDEIWCAAGDASISGASFKPNTCTLNAMGVFRRNDPSLRRNVTFILQWPPRKDPNRFSIRSSSTLLARSLASKRATWVRIGSWALPEQEILPGSTAPLRWLAFCLRRYAS
jgi:hypothetical protein